MLEALERGKPGVLEPIGMIPPAEAELLFYSERELVDETGTQGNESL